MSTTERLAPPLIRAVLSALALTLRFRVVEGADQVAGLKAGGPAVLGFWHHQLPACALFVTRRLVSENRRVTSIVSQSRDGEIAARVVAPWGVDLVRGSSSRGGVPGLRGLLRALAQGQMLAFTPDGPRGPAQVAKPGLLALAQRGRQPAVPLAARTQRPWRLRSWDRMEIPRPFSRVLVGLGTPIPVALDDDLDEAAQHFATALDELSARLLT